MKIYMYPFSLITCLIFFSQTYAGNNDSLWGIYNNAQNADSNRLEALDKIAWDLLYSNPDSTYIIGHRELEIARDKKYKKQESQALNTIGASFQIKGNLLKAIEMYQQSLKIREELGDKKGVSASLSNIGSIYISINELDKALGYQQRSLKMFEEMKNNEGKASAFNNIGLIYNNLSDFPKALDYCRQSLKLYEELGDKAGIRAANDNIGSAYFQAAEYSKALEFYIKSLAIATEMGDKQNSSITLSWIGKSYMKKKMYSHALDNLDKAKLISLELEDIYSEREVSSVLYETYKAMGNKDKALKNYERFIVLRDSISKEENLMEINNKELEYEYKKKAAGDSIKNDEEQKVKDALIYAKNAQIEQDKTQKWALYGGLFLGFVFGGLMYNRFRITSKQKKIIEIKNKETEDQKTVIEKKQKEILSSISYAKRLQEAILPPQKLVKQYLSESFFLYKPKDIVAGDFYWFEVMQAKMDEARVDSENPAANKVFTSPDNIFIAAADCTGHGVPGAMVSVVCSNALNRTVKEFGISEPGKILDKVRELVIETFEKSESEVNDGMDISLCCLNKKKNELQWSGANNPLWIIRDNKFIEFKPDKQCIGKMDDPSIFTTHIIPLKINDLIYLFTDGYADQFGGEKGKKFKYQQLKELLLANSHLSMLDQKEILNNTIEEWKGNLEQVDDILIIGIKV